MSGVDSLNLNWHFMLKKVLGRPTCILGKGTRLYSSARIRNAVGSNQAINIGAGSLIKGELLTFRHGGAINIGRHCFIGEGTRIWSATNIDIDDRTLISHNVNIVDNLTHSMNPEKRHEQFLSIAAGKFPVHDNLEEQPIRIAQDVLIGCQAIVLKGVSIGRGAVVGAGAVVTKDVPEYSVVAGNPAQVIRQLRPEEYRSAAVD